MSLQFKPDPGAQLDSHWHTVFLSMRDASSRIPINYINFPGVHLTKACFSSGVYDDIPAQRCISNLLASQFRRLIVDLYWDNINQQFNLCPVELPPLSGNATAGYSVNLSALSSITAMSTSAATAAPVGTPASNSSNAGSPLLGKRQSVEGNSSSSMATPSTNTSSSSMTAAPIPTSTGVSGTTLLELGPYTCSLDLNLGSIVALYNDYITSTSDTISARLHFLRINLHAAAPFLAPTDPAHAPMPARLPQPEDLVGAQFESTLSRTLYTPNLLLEDRANLNRSWFRDSFRSTTDGSYFTIEPLSERFVFTEDGWPGEGWLILSDSRRLLLTWGEIDPQMRGYDFATDSSLVFSHQDLSSMPQVESDSAGNLTSGCLFHPGKTTASQNNASWALSTINETNSNNVLMDLAQNMIACGMSPILNYTLEGADAQDNLAPYRTFAQSTVFGWGAGEPLNGSSVPVRSGTTQEFRCAVMDSTDQYRGRWRVEDCQGQRRAACRIADQPYAWRLSTSNVAFEFAPAACPEHTTFDLPRTGLENTYLHQQILADASSEDSDAHSFLSGVWINFNSLDTTDCWVTGGPNATCPYSNYEQEEQQRQVLIPTIAALIVLLLTVLTLLVKCNQNRRNSRTRRRGDNGWEYEGVPS